MIGRLRLFVALFALGAAAPQPVLKVDRGPSGAPTAVMTQYLQALQHKDYAKAFALLDPTQRSYYRNAENFATVFTADDIALRSFNVFGTRHDKRGYAYFVQEKVSLRDYATAATLSHDLSAVYGVFPIGGLRTRVEERHEYRIADGDPANAFVHVTMRIGAGRDAATKAAAAQTVFAALCDQLEPAFAATPLAISLELQEIDPALSFKHNNLHEYVKRERSHAG